MRHYHTHTHTCGEYFPLKRELTLIVGKEKLSLPSNSFTLSLFFILLCNFLNDDFPLPRFSSYLPFLTMFLLYLVGEMKDSIQKISTPSRNYLLQMNVDIYAKRVIIQGPNIWKVMGAFLPFLKCNDI